jgi:3-phenylpropionate/trans-cinnamate dioxygenase ferredoxin subunit
MAWLPVAGADQVAPGEFIQVDTGTLFILVCNAAGELFAIEDMCSHDGSSMLGGCIEGDEIICPRHGARFCLRNGAPMAPPAYEGVQTFPVRINDRNIEIDLPTT